MDVRCERCRAQYVFDDSHVTEAGLAVKCSKCGHLFRVKRKALVVTVPVSPSEIGSGTPMMADDAARPFSSPTPPPTGKREWRVRQANGTIYTFRELTTLQKWIVERKVGRGDEISVSGDQWKRLGAISELAAFFLVVEEAERARSKAPVITPPAFRSTSPDRQPSNTPAPVARPTSDGASWESQSNAEGVTRENPLPEDARAAASATSEDPAWTNQRPERSRSDFEDEETRPIADHPPRRSRLILPILGLIAAAVGIFLMFRACEGGDVRVRNPDDSTPPADDVGAKIDEKTTAPRADTAPVASLPQPAQPESLPDPADLDNIPEPVIEPAPPEPAPPAVVAKPESADGSPDAADAPDDTPEKPEKEVPEKKVAEKKEPDKKPDTKKGEDSETKTVKSLLAQAKKLQQRGQSQNALDFLAQAIELEPENVDALATRGWCYLELSRYAMAESSFQQALSYRARYADALMGLAETYRYQGRRSDAVRYYEQYLDANPEGEEAVAARNAIEKLKE